jgi:hypothetical protein
MCRLFHRKCGHEGPALLLHSHGARAMTRLAAAYDAQKKSAPSATARPDCSVAQLALGTPLSLRVAQSERPVKI